MYVSLIYSSDDNLCGSGPSLSLQPAKMQVVGAWYSYRASFFYSNRVHIIFTAHSYYC